jgi:hypothetical protein
MDLAVTTSSASISHNCAVSISCVMPGRRRCNSPNLRAPPIRLWTIKSFHLPPMTLTAPVTGLQWISDEGAAAFARRHPRASENLPA